MNTPQFHPRLRPQMGADEAMAIYDSLEPIDVAQLQGRWEGYEVQTGHPMEGVLQASSWYGKEFNSPEDVFPLVHRGPFGQLLAINPALMPLGLVMRATFLRHPVVTAIFKILMPLFSTRKSRARLRMIEYRGKVSATMIYDAKAINDHFRLLEPGHVMGVMDLKGVDKPYFFALKKVRT